MDYYVMCQLILVGLLGEVCRSQIVKGPSSQTVSSTDSATFNCSISCFQSVLPVMWYLTVPSSGRTVAVSPFTSLAQVRSIYGIEVIRRTANECPQGGYVVEQLVVRAKQQLHLMPIQCSTICIGEGCACDETQVNFSKLAILSVLDGVVVPSTSSTTALPVASTTSFNVCPSQSLQAAKESVAMVTVATTQSTPYPRQP